MDKEVFLLCVSPLIINLGLGIYLAFTISRQRLTASARSLLALILGALLWSFGYSMEFISPVFEDKLFWGKFQYFGITTVPMAWFSFAFQHLGFRGWSERSLKQRIALSVLPLLTLGLVWTNDFHGLVWRDVHLQAIGSFQILGIEHGPVFWIYLAFSYCLLLAGSVKWLSGLLASYHISRWRTILRLIAILIPWLGNLIYVTELNPIPHVDWSPLSFTISGLLFSISLYRFSLVDILPIAQKKVFAVLPDCLLVLDAQNNLTDMNAAAQKMIANPKIAWRAKPLAEVFPELAQWVSLADLREEYRAEITQGIAPDQHFHDLRIIPLSNPSGMAPVGRLVVCHEITRHKRAQDQLEKIRAQLEEAVTERTAELRRTVAQLQVELDQRTLAERRFEEVIESAPDAMLLVDQASTIRLVNAQTVRLFGYSKDELLGQNLESLIATNLRKRHRKYVNQYIADPSIRQISFGLTLSARRKDGSKFPADISLGTLNTSDGVWIACSVRDITERMKAVEEQNQLLEEIKQSREQLRALAVRLSEAQEYEQRQIAVELHDRVGQNLTGLNLNLQVIQNLLPAEGFSPIHSRLEDSMDLVEETMRQVRSLMADLNPPLLEEYGLGAALRFSCEKFAERTGIATTLFGEDFYPRLSQREEMALFRITQEALNNVVKHALAAQVRIRMEASGRFVSLSVEDDGQGFDPQNYEKAGSQPHWGLLNIHERAASIGGELQIHSAPGAGTCLKITIQRGGPND